MSHNVWYDSLLFSSHNMNIQPQVLKELVSPGSRKLEI